ncbi:MAG: hypothetical protein HYZ29_04370 [Myxococcales bacterium]|nr:hypothetical protein [Myxococcales bacterium]
MRERWNDVYPPTTQIVKVGRGSMPKDSIALKHDEHPEYLADELLVMTQGLDVGANDGESTGRDVSESREPGQFGEARWTQKAGMPWFDEASGKEGEASDATEKKPEKKKAKKGAKAKKG